MHLSKSGAWSQAALRMGLSKFTEQKLQLLIQRENTLMIILHLLGLPILYFHLTKSTELCSKATNTFL